MVQSCMKKGSLKNYLKQSRITGVYSYRRGIPERLRPYFRNSDGKLRGREWKEPLKTNNLSIALVLLAKVNQQFEQTKQLAEIELANLSQPLNEREGVERFLNYIKREGIHPDYAPSVLAPEHEQKAWLSKQSDAIFELKEIQTEFIDQIGDEFDGAQYIPQKTYYVIEEQINFLKGINSSIKSKLRPTWGSAYEEYIEDKINNKYSTPDQLTKSKLNRTKRVATNFADFLGHGDVNIGWETFLTDISRSEAKRYFDYQIHAQNRKGSTVGREIAVLLAIYNHAVTEHKRDEPSLSSESNPFAKLRSKAEEKHEDDIRIGKSPNLSARAWTPQEMEGFKNRLPSMSSELRLISLISLHTGARLKDTTGLMLGDVHISNEENSFIHYRHNKNRKISKDSIERIVPIYGTLLNELNEYKSYCITLDQESLFPKYCGSRGSDSASNLLNQRHLDTINKDKSFKMHGLRKTLMAKFDVALVPNSVSGYLIGWRDNTTVGMQEEYKSGYPHAMMLSYMKKAQEVKDWAIRY